MPQQHQWGGNQNLDYKLEFGMQSLSNIFLVLSCLVICYVVSNTNTNTTNTTNNTNNTDDDDNDNDLFYGFNHALTIQLDVVMF